MYKIAVIEDDTLLGQALVEMLTSHGYQAFAAESVTKARRLLERPVALAVLLKHVEAVLRRTGGEPNQVFYYQDFTLDYDRKEVKIQGQPVALTPKEYGILEILTKNKKKVVTKRMLLEQVWDDGGNFVEENTLHVTLNRLKKKIEPDPAHPVYVKNVFGLGYTFGE